MIKKYIAITVGVLLSIGLIGWNVSQELRYRKDPLEESFREFQIMSAEDFHILWHKKYYKSVYVLDCKTQYDEWNCSVAVWGVLIDLGANLQFKDEEGKYINTEEILKQLKLYSYKIRKAKDIKGKEIVVFKPNKNNIPHVAFIERINHKKNILLLEMNAVPGGTNYRWIKYNDKKIDEIYPVTQGLWRGEEE